MYINEKTFYEKLAIEGKLKKQKHGLHRPDTFYDNAKKYLEVQGEKQQGTEADF